MKYSVTPLTCGRCVRSITDSLLTIDPAAKVLVDLSAGTVEADGNFDGATVVATLSAIGYQASPADVKTLATGGRCCGTCSS